MENYNSGVSNFKQYKPKNGVPYYTCNYKGKKCKFHIIKGGEDIFIQFGCIPKNIALQMIKNQHSEKPKQIKDNNKPYYPIDYYMINKYYDDLKAGACEQVLDFEKKIGKI